MDSSAQTPGARTGAPRPRLVRPAAARPAALVDDPDARAVRSAVAAGGPHLILGAAGTGKTALLVRLAVDAVARGVPPHRVLLLTPTRAAAARLGALLAAHPGLAGTPRIHSMHSYAFAVLRRAAAMAGQEPPRLLEAPEQDLVVAELLAGHAAGEGRSVVWPESFGEAASTSSFRSALLDLFAQVAVQGLGPRALAQAGRRQGAPVWVAAAAVFEEYQQVSALRSPGAYDPVTLLRTAAGLLATTPQLALAEGDPPHLVLVDDYQDVDPAMQTLLRGLAGPGGNLVAAGDPDAGVSGFRGGDHDLLRAFRDRFRGPAGQPALTHLLTRQWRVPPTLRQLAGGVAARLPGPGVTRRAWGGASASGAQPGGADVRFAGSRAAQAADLAARLRATHLRDGVAWSRMVVIARTTRQTSSLRRALARAGVPVTGPPDRVPLRETPAVMPLLAAFSASVTPGAPDPSTVTGLLDSPIGGGDGLAVRRLRQALLARERAAGGDRSSDELLVAAVDDPACLAGLPSAVTSPARRVAAVLHAGREAAAAAGADAQTVLWALWRAAGLEASWRARALRGGVAGMRADRDLDAVMALFAAAARFVDRAPAAGPRPFLDHVRGAGLPAGPPTAPASATDAVPVLTPHAAAGGEWDIVVVAGLQEGIWPDLRPRGGLLQAQRLAEVLAGRADTPLDEAHLRRSEETRLLYVAVTRARRQVWLSAVSDDDEAPSELFELCEDLAVGGERGSGGSGQGRVEGPRPLDAPAPPMELSALVAQLRAVVCACPPGDAGDDGPLHPAARAAAAHLLATLAHAGVTGADPADWSGLAPLSDPAPLVDETSAVVVSPSRVETFTRCPLRWLLETSGGRAGDATQARVGELVHAVAAAHPQADRARLHDELARLWPRLGLPDTWVTRATRARAERMVDKLAAYQEQAQREGRRLVGTELAFHVDVDGGTGRVDPGRGPGGAGASDGAAAGGRTVRLAGRVDRLERDAQGRLVVVDLKTGRSKPTRAEVARHPQLGVYQVAVASGAFDEASGAVDETASGSREPGGAVLVPLGDTATGVTPAQQPPLAASDEPGWAGELVQAVATGMAGADFPATANPSCRHCPVIGSCPLHAPGRTVVS